MGFLVARADQIIVEGTVLAEGGHGFYTVALGNGAKVQATLGSGRSTREWD